MSGFMTSELGSRSSSRDGKRERKHDKLFPRFGRKKATAKVQDTSQLEESHEAPNLCQPEPNLLILLIAQ